MMRGWPVALLLAAGCGKHEDKAPPSPKIAPEADADDPPCDPKVPKVCLGDDVVACEENGRLGRRLRACHAGCEHGHCKGACSDEAVKLIYLVDDANELLSFDPRKLPGDPYTRIGRLTCEGGSGTPFSMSVDRNGIAWVLYEDGELFKVDITDAHCEVSGYRAGATGALVFGMGFSTDSAGGGTEKLYMAADDSTNALHSLDTSKTLTPRRIGTIEAANNPNPELTGGSSARLFGFYPEMAGAFVQEIDRANGRALGPKWSLGPLGDVNAYAFAQWAGVFYIFTTTLDDDFRMGSSVRSLDPATGTWNTVITNAPFRVTGAGVSTCAPERDAKRP